MFNNQPDQPKTKQHTHSWIRTKISRIPKWVCIDLAGSKENVLILGSGRSGTTWITNLVNYNHDHRIVFEPFRKYCYEKHNHVLFPPEDPSSKPARFQVNQLEKIFSGKLNYRFVNQFNKKFIAHKRIIKSIRCFFIIDLIWEKFHPEIIHILRHPLAVVRSQLVYFKTDTFWKKNYPIITNQQWFLSKFTGEQINLIQSAETHFEHFFIQWCIHNSWTFQALQAIPHHRVFYERIKENLHSELGKINQYLSSDFQPDATKKIEIVRTTRYIDQDQSSENSIYKWKNYFSDEQLNKARHYLEVFNLSDIYSMDDFFPLDNP